MKDDIAEVLKEMPHVDLKKDDNNLTVMWALLGVVSHNRSFDDKHPSFANGNWKRILPYDGRDYCFYYADDCNDKNVATALRAIRKELIWESTHDYSKMTANDLGFNL